MRDTEVPMRIPFRTCEQKYGPGICEARLIRQGMKHPLGSLKATLDLLAIRHAKYAKDKFAVSPLVMYQFTEV